MAQALRGSIVDNAGAPLSGVKITVYIYNTANLATLYSDKALTSQTTNPIYSEADGAYLVYAADGSYDLKFEKTDVTFDDSDSVDEICFDGPAHKSAVAGAHTASAVTNVPDGNIAATTVQGAINELDDEKLSGEQRAAFFVNLAASQTGLTGSSAYKVNYDTESFDTTNSFGAYKFVAPVTAKFDFAGQVTVKSDTGTLTGVTIYIYVNGTSYAYFPVSTSIAAGNELAVSVPPVFLSLAVTDYVEVFALASTSSGTWQIVGSAGVKKTTFHGHHVVGA